MGKANSRERFFGDELEQRSATESQQHHRIMQRWRPQRFLFITYKGGMIEFNGIYKIVSTWVRKNISCCSICVFVVWVFKCLFKVILWNCAVCSSAPSFRFCLHPSSHIALSQTDNALRWRHRFGRLSHVHESRWVHSAKILAQRSTNIVAQAVLCTNGAHTVMDEQKQQSQQIPGNRNIAGATSFSSLWRSTIEHFPNDEARA